MTDTTESTEQVVTEEHEPQPVLSIRQTVSLAALPQAQGESLAALWRFMQRKEVAAAGPPFVRYHTFGDQETDVEIGIPVSAPTTGDGRITSGRAARRTGDHDVAPRVARHPRRRLRSATVLADRPQPGATRRRVGDLHLDRPRRRAGPAVLART